MYVILIYKGYVQYIIFADAFLLCAYTLYPYNVNIKAFMRIQELDSSKSL